MEAKKVLSSEIFFHEDIPNIETVEIIQKRNSDLENIQTEAKKRAYSSIKGLNMFWKEHKKLSKRIKKPFFDEKIRKIQKKIEKLQSKTSLKHSRERATNELIDLKANYSFLDNSVLISAKSFKEIHFPFVRKAKAFLKKAQIAKAILENIKNRRKLSSLRKKFPSYQRSVDEFTKSPDFLQKLNQKLCKKISDLAQIDDFLKKTSLENKSCRELFVLFNQKNQKETCTFSNFYKSFKILKYNYIGAKKYMKNDEEEKTKRINFLLNLIGYVNDKKSELFYFDCTSVSEKNLKKKAWSNRFEKTSFKPLFRYQTTHIMMLISLKSVVSFQFMKGNLSTRIIFLFLKESIRRIKQNLHGKCITIILDNAPMNKTQLIKNLAVKEKVKFVFIPPNNPYFNMIEYLFRFIKRGLKKKNTLQ